MACPLSLLRQYNVNKTEIIERDDQVIFGEFSWSKSVKTNYLMYGSGKDGSPKAYYTLGCALYLLKNSCVPHAAYVRQAMTDGVPIVRRPDRKDLLSYLNGLTATSLAIDKLAALEPPAKVKREAENSLNNGASKKPRLVVTLDDSLDDESARRANSLDDERARRARERLAAKLHAHEEEVSVVSDSIKSLSETMSADKIAAIKAKRIAKKRATIKRHDDVEMDRAFEVVADVHSEVAKRILSRERVLRTRATILRSSGKDLAVNVFNVLKSIKAEESASCKENVPPTTTTMTPRQSPPKRRQLARRTGYDRYDQQRFVRHQKEAAQGFFIDTTRTYHGMNLQSVTAGCAAVPRAPSALSVTPRRRSSKIPIIVVPSSEASLINMYNARDILQDFTYKSTAEMKAARGGRRESEILLQRRKGDGNLTVPYLVIDDPSRLNGHDDWNRVVAVFVMGPQWQFKGWPCSGDPVRIFSRIRAFHLKYDEMPVDANVARWAVTIIQLGKTRRHLDRAAIMKFWLALDRHIGKNKPHLRF